MLRLYRFISLFVIVALLGILGLLVSPVALADTQGDIAQYEPDVEITGNDTYPIYNKEIAGQTFMPTITHDVSYIAIYGHITGDPTYVMVQLRTGNGTVIATTTPTKNLVYHWLGSKSEVLQLTSYFTGNESGSWVVCQLNHAAKLEANTLYAVVVKAPAGDSGNSFNWHYNNEGNPYTSGTASTSSNDGATWTALTNDDFMFETWGESGLKFQSVEVYNSFYEDNDWLIVCSYLNKAPTHYKEKDIEQYFRLKLYENNSGDVVGETVIRSWDASVASIYLNPDETSSLEWETGNFTLKIEATYGGGFEISHDLVPANFVGDTLDFLDKWCISQAQWMGTTNKGDDLYYVRETPIGMLLNEKGIQQFDLGIPRLGAIRGEYIYETYFDEAELNPLATPNPALQNRFVWQTQLGVQFAGILDDLGAPFNLSGKLVGLIGMLMLYVFVVGGSFPAGHGTAGSVAGFIIVLIGMIAGVTEVVWVIIFAIIAFALALRQLVLVGQ
jgi:hypothetical protein